MFFLLELILTGVAFFRGWRWRALLPLTVDIFSMFIALLMIRPNRTDLFIEQVGTIGFTVEVVMIVTLFVMVIKGRETKKEEPDEQKQ